MSKKSRECSLLPVDIGFDLRYTGYSVRIYERFSYRYLDQNDKQAFVYPDADFGSTTNLVATAEVLARAGYHVVPFKTPDGRDVDLVPSGIREEEGKIVWNVRSQYGLKWYQGDTLQEALANLEWKIDDLRPLSSDEYL